MRKRFTAPVAVIRDQLPGDISATLGECENEVGDVPGMPQQPYASAKFFTAMRHRLRDMDLPASAIGLLIGLHTICDADTGQFARDDVTLRQTLGMAKSTVSWAFKRLLTVGLVAEISENEFTLVHYEQDRVDAKSYFRINQPLLNALPGMISHHNPNIILLALEILDRARHFDSEIVYGITHLIYKARLGSCRSRVLKALELLQGIALWTPVPNSSNTGDNIHFFPIKEETVPNEDQQHFRQLHGQVSGTTKKSYEFVRGVKPSREPLAPFTWRELARSTRIIIQYGIEHHLEDRVIVRLGGVFGAYCANSAIKRRIPYLRKALPDLVRHLMSLAS